MIYHYKTKGTCSREIIVELEKNIIQSVQIIGGCSGNTQGISALVKGMRADEVVRRCRGIRCGSKPTSCPDQLANAIMMAGKLQDTCPE